MAGTVFIVDDNKLNLETLSVLLRKEGYDSVTMTSPRDIYEILDKVTQVLVIFLDLEYPDDNGFLYIDSLKTHPALQGVPIIAYSVHINEIQEAREVGFDGFLGKPLHVSHFPDQLKRILNGEQVWELGQ